jgi:hypothetical protein
MKVKVGDKIYCAKCEKNAGKIVKIGWSDFAKAYKITCQCGACVYITATGHLNGTPIIKTKKYPDWLN